METYSPDVKSKQKSMTVKDLTERTVVGQQNDLRYQVDDNPGFVPSVLLGFQNVLTAFGGIIAVPLVIAGVAGLDVTMTAFTVSAGLLVSGIVSIIQSYGVGPKWFRVGSGLPTIMGTDFGFVAPANAVINTMGGGMAGYVGGTFLGAIIEVILSYFIKPLMRFFPPVVTGTVITLMGMTLMPVAFDWVGGGAGAADFGSLQNITIASFVFLVITVINHYAPKNIASAAVLIGMAIGYIVCIPFGLVDFAQVINAPWFALPKILPFGIDLNPAYILPFLAGYLVTVIETVGVVQTIGQVTYQELTDDQIAAGVRCDGVGSMIGPVLGSGPVATFSQNAGLIPLTKNASRIVAIFGGIILIIMSLFPKFATLVSIMPTPVLGGAGILLFGTVAASGIQSLSKVPYNNRNLLIISSSLAIGLGVSFKPELTASLPGILNALFSSGISAGTIVALFLNIILVEKKED